MRADEGLRVYFNLDDMVVSDAVIKDSLIDYEETYNGTMGLSDSINLNFIDLDSAMISCEINNPCAFKLEFIGVVEDAWDCDFARANNIRSITQLSSIMDSSASGKVVNDTLFRYSGATHAVKMIPLKKLRLFPTWDTDSAKAFLSSVTSTFSSDGRWVHFNKDDLISVKLIPTKFPFVQISGNFTSSTVETFSSEEKSVLTGKLDTGFSEEIFPL